MINVSPKGLVCCRILLPPANEVWGKLIFSQASVSHSVHSGRGGRGGCLPLGLEGSVCLWVQGVYTPSPRHTHPSWTHNPPLDTPSHDTHTLLTTLPPGHTPSSPWSKSRWYASYSCCTSIVANIRSVISLNK